MLQYIYYICIMNLRKLIFRLKNENNIAVLLTITVILMIGLLNYQELEMKRSTQVVHFDAEDIKIDQNIVTYLEVRQ